MKFRVFVSKPIPKEWLEPLVASLKIDLSIHESTESLSREAWERALGVADEQALIEALKVRKIAGAGLDVYEHEPFVPEALKTLKNVVLTPHIGSATF